MEVSLIISRWSSYRLTVCFSFSVISTILFKFNLSTVALNWLGLSNSADFPFSLFCVYVQYPLSRAPRVCCHHQTDHLQCGF